MSTVLPQDNEAGVSAPRRRFTLRHLSIALLVVLLLVSGYLSYEKIAATNVVCVEGGAFNCGAVTHSIYSKFPQGTGIDVAYLGFTLDAIMIVLLLLEPRVRFLQSYGMLIIFGLALWGFLFHDYLTLMSVTRIRALCIWCLTHHTVMTILLIVSSIRLYRLLFRNESDYIEAT
jgi:uncharacterized membrane protein